MGVLAQTLVFSLSILSISASALPWGCSGVVCEQVSVPNFKIPLPSPPNPCIPGVMPCAPSSGGGYSDTSISLPPMVPPSAPSTNIWCAMGFIQCAPSNNEQKTPTPAPAPPKVCSPGQTYKQDCSTCTCNSYGSGWACNFETCPPAPAPTVPDTGSTPQVFPYPCVPGSMGCFSPNDYVIPEIKPKPSPPSPCVPGSMECFIQVAYPKPPVSFPPQFKPKPMPPVYFAPKGNLGCFFFCLY